MSLENLACTERHEESYMDNQSKVTKNKTKKVTIEMDKMASLGRINKDLVASMESLDSLDNSQPMRTARDDVLESLGYKPHRAPKPFRAGQINLTGIRNLCHYCGRRVYPMEKVDIGELYHKGCFKCHTCGLQLTLKTFCKVSSGKTEIYCKSHVPKLEASYDKEAIEIQAAIKAQRKASEKVIKQYEPSPNKYDPDAIEFRHARDLKQRKKLVRRKSLKTTADYQKFGVFEAQEELERRQRLEEDKLYQEMNEERKNQIKNLEAYLTNERERTVKELIGWFEGQSTPEEERATGLQKIEQYYKEQRELKIKDLLDKMHFEEQEAVTRLTEKHAQEMLIMIEQRDHEVTEELGKHRPSYSRRLSYKEMQYHEDLKDDDDEEDDDGDDDDDDALENIDEEEHKDDDDDENDDYDVEKKYDPAEYAGREIYGRRHETSSIKNNHQITSDKQSPEFEVMGRKYFIRKDESKYTLPSESEATTERLDNFTSAQKGRREKFEKKKVDTSEDSLITEEIQDNKQQDSSRGLKHEKQTGRNQRKQPGQDAASVSSGISVEQSQQSQQSKKESKPKTKLSSKKPKTRIPKDVPVVVAQVDDDDDDDDADEEDDDDDEETIEDRIKKVLKKSNMNISYDNKQKDTNVSYQDKQDKNVWRGNTSDLGSFNSNNKSSASEEKPRRITTSQENRSDRRVQQHNSRERLDISDETAKSEEDSNPRMSIPPKAEPPLCRKSKLYKDPEIFREFDDNAFEEAKRDPTSFTDLLRRLSYKCKNDLQKVRAIFRWITAKDLNKMEFSKDLSSNSPMGLLRGIKSGTETYHNLFKRLCSYVGIHCKVINGFSKGVGYRPGSKFRDNKFRNQWTAVWIKDSWRFINCNWGARHVKQQGDLQLTYKIDEFYFLTDPEDHIQQHFPDDPRWQLLRKPVSIDEFVHMPVVKSPFFNNKLEFNTKTDSILKASHEGVVELCLRSPNLMSFAAKLQSKDHSFTDEQLSQQCLIRTKNDCTIFMVVLPQHGRYYLDIFVDRRLNSRTLDNACSFLIYCPQLPTLKILNYPQICFGRMPESEALNLKISPEFDPHLKIKGEVQLDINLKSKTNIKTSLSMSYIHHQDSKEVDCSQYVTILSRTKSYLSCFIRCPKKGHYVMNLLATDKSLPTNSSVPIYKFFVDCRTPSEKTKYLPHTTSRFRDCKLIEPLDGELVTNSNVCFRIESGSAFEVLVSVNDAWFSLQKIENLWQGIINTGPKVGKITIFGRFKEEDDKYIPFVEYFVKEPSMAEEVHALFKYMN